MMYVLCVTVHVKPEDVSDFVAATVDYAKQIRLLEPGNVRYDLLQSDEDETCFVIYEAYQSKDDFLFHRETSHADQWKAQIEPWMTIPRERIRCNSILFENG
jgi:autoinducer 2-degrading protein